MCRVCSVTEFCSVFSRKIKGKKTWKIAQCHEYIYVYIHLSVFFCPSFSSPLRSSSLLDKREEIEGIWAIVISKVRGIGGSSSRKAKGKVTQVAGVINFVAPVENHPFLLKSTYISVYFNFVAQWRASFSLENDIANLNVRELDPTLHLE